MTFASTDEACPHCWDEVAMIKPMSTTTVHRDECAYCCRECTDGDGIYVCMRCFTGVCRGHAAKHLAAHTDHSMYTRVKELPQEEKPEVTDTTRLGVLVPKMYEYAVCCAACQLQFLSVPDFALASHEGIIHAPVPGAQAAQEEGPGFLMRPQCPHLVCLEQDPSPYASRAAPTSQDVCAVSGCDCCLNNWMCVTCGAIGCPRAEAGGKGHALSHYEATGHPTVVKLGTITADGADYYCYNCDDDVSDVHFVTHMVHFGIDVHTATKTAKTLGEMEYDYSSQLDFNRITEAGTDLVPVYGPGRTGIYNSGNTCYLASVVQCLMSLPAFQEAFYPHRTSPHQGPCIENPYDCRACQTERIAAGLLSGDFSIDGAPQKGVGPRLLKRVYAGRHPDFSSNEQQDAQEYLLYLLEEMRRHVKPVHVGRHPASTLDLVMEQRVQCNQCKRVRYSLEKESCLSLSIPIDPATIPAPNPNIHLSDKELEALRPRVTLVDCLNAMVQANPIECQCEACGATTVYDHTTRLQAFPDVLAVNVRRTYFDKTTFTTNKMDVYVEAPETLELGTYRAHGQQADEVIMAPSQAAPRKVGKSKAIEVDELALVTVVSMGIDVDVARYALTKTDMNVERAVDYILSHPAIEAEMVAATAAAPVAAEELPVPTAPVSGPASYTLTAMISHMGASAKTGHYVCHIRDPATGKWVLFNDEKVGQSQKPPFSLASIYFYQRNT